MDIKVKILVRRVAKGKLKKARFYAAFRVSQSPNPWYKSEEDRRQLVTAIYLYVYLNRKKEELGYEWE